MAKSPRGITHNEVLDWFSGLSFEVQESVLGKFSQSFEASKQERIAKLEKELSALRTGLKEPASTLRKKVSPKKGIKVPPKYMHKETGQTWAGRGVQPTWLREYLKKRGNKLEDLLIKK